MGKRSKAKSGVTLWKARGIYRKLIGKQRRHDGSLTPAVFYFGADEGAASIEANAIKGRWRFLKGQGHTAWPPGEPNRESLKAANGLTFVPIVNGPSIPTAAWVAANGSPIAPSGRYSSLGDALAHHEPPERLVHGSALSVEDAAKLYLSEQQAAKGDRWGKDIRQRLGVAIDRLGRTKALISIDRAAVNEFGASWRSGSNSHLYARNVCNALKAFLIWAAEHEQIGWQRPSNLESALKIQAKITADLKPAKKHLTVDEMATLFKAADSRMRCFMAISLNTTYYGEDLADLKGSHLVTIDGKRYIRNQRKKTSGKTPVIRQHLLWAETAALIDANRDGKDDGYLFASKTKDGRLSKSTLSKAWDELRESVGIPEACFSHLRDTSSNDIRNIAGDDIASIHLGHADGNKMLAAYTDRPFAKLDAALIKLRKRYAPVLAA